MLGATADDHHATAGLRQQLRGCFDRGGRGNRQVGNFVGLPVIADAHFHDVDGNGDVHRAWPARTEYGKSLRNQLGYFCRIMHHCAERGERARDRTQVGGLMQASPALAERCAVIGARNDQHRNRIGIGLADAGGRVGDARTGDQSAHTGLAGNARVAVSHEARTLLIARGDRAHITFFDATVELQRVLPGNTKNSGHTVGFE